MRADVGQHQRARVLDQQAEDPAPAREVADRRVRGRVDAAGEEALERPPLRVEHADGRVARAGQLACGLQQPLEHDLEVELGDERAAGLQEPRGGVGGVLRHRAD